MTETRLINKTNGKRDRKETGKFEKYTHKLNGKGEIIYYDTDGKTEYCRKKGTFTDGKLNGKGEVIPYYKNGNKRVEAKGIIKDKKLNGQGEIIKYDGNGIKRNELKGTFKDGELHGEGRLIIYDENGNITKREEV